MAQQISQRLLQNLVAHYSLRATEFLAANWMKYRRAFVPGASYFLTLTLQDRRSNLLIEKITELRIAFQQVRNGWPFTIDGIVILPEHLHMTITLPPDDINYSQRITFIKSAFSRQITPKEFITQSRKAKQERGIWQRRFWEHPIRDEQDYEEHLNYIHYNPVKHGHVKSPSQWAFSSIHRYIRAGILPLHWTIQEVMQDQDQTFGE